MLFLDYDRNEPGNASKLDQHNPVLKIEYLKSELYGIYYILKTIHKWLTHHHDVIHLAAILFLVSNVNLTTVSPKLNRCSIFWYSLALQSGSTILIIILYMLS